MPDWTYRTVFRPLLFRLPMRAALGLALGSLGRLGSVSIGRAVIDWMGHMRPDSRLQLTVGTLTADSRVGLACGLNPAGTACGAFSRFGFGLLEVGPVALEGSPLDSTLTRDDSGEAICRAVGAVGVVELEQTLRHLPTRTPAVVARLSATASDDEVLEIVRRLPSSVHAVSAPASWPLERLLVLSAARPLILLLDADAPLEDAAWFAARNKIASAWWVVPAAAATEWTLGKPQYELALQTTRRLRTLADDAGQAPGADPDAVVIGQAVGVHSAEDALAALDAGADMVLVDSGLVFSGPGLPKRVNEALLHRMLMDDAREEPAAAAAKPAHYSWYWALLMGAAMFVGGVLAMAIALTRVVLPYDESMSQLSREQLASINPRLLDFMTHDRVTLSGTMLCVGLIYAMLAWRGMRRGLHWPRRTVITSALAGFLSFFSFLGFGYFDPFHAFVTALLFQLLLLVMHSDAAPRPTRAVAAEAPELTDSPRWLLSQWGQLIFVIHGAVLIVAGAVITSIGMTDVFVREDLEFMQTTLDCFEPYPTLIPLVAHDRATFGGMLISCGAAVLCCALWGFRRGDAWLWWTLMAAGNAAYGATIWVHWAVGYDSLKHLLPAYGGWLLLWIGGLLSLPHLVLRDEALEQRWRRWLRRPTETC